MYKTMIAFLTSVYNDQLLKWPLIIDKCFLEFDT